MSAGTVIRGGLVSESMTWTGKVVSVAWLPALSCALQWTVVSPTSKCEPEAGAQLAAKVPSTVSCAFGGVYVTLLPAGSAVVTETSACGSIVGGVVSTMVIVNDL